PGELLEVFRVECAGRNEVLQHGLVDKIRRSHDYPLEFRFAKAPWGPYLIGPGAAILSPRALAAPPDGRGGSSRLSGRLQFYSEKKPIKTAFEKAGTGGGARLHASRFRQAAGGGLS